MQIAKMESKSALGGNYYLIFNDGDMTHPVLCLAEIEMQKLVQDFNALHTPIATYSVTMTSHGSYKDGTQQGKIYCIKVLRDLFSMSLKDAKDVTESLPLKLATGKGLDAAHLIVSTIRQAGGEAHMVQE